MTFSDGGIADPKLSVWLHRTKPSNASAVASVQLAALAFNIAFGAQDGGGTLQHGGEWDSNE